MSQPLDESQAGHLFLPLCADLSVRFCRSFYLALPCPLYRTTIRSPISDHAFYPQIAFSIGAPGSLRSVLPLGAFGNPIVAVRMFLGSRVALADRGTSDKPCARSSGSRRDASMRSRLAKIRAGTCGQPPEANYRFLCRAQTPPSSFDQIRSSTAALSPSGPDVSTGLRLAICPCCFARSKGGNGFRERQNPCGIPGRGSKHRRRLYPQA